MKHYNDFIIKLQTLDIKISLKRSVAEGTRGELSVYSISHQNPHLNDGFANELKALRELALTDILNLPGEQIQLQLQRLGEVKERFNKFWYNLNHSDVPIGTEHLTDLLFSLDLKELFILPALSFQDHAKADVDFMHDLEDTIRARQKVLGQFEESVLKVTQVQKSPEKQLFTKPIKKEEATPVFKRGIALEFYDLIKDYFKTDHQPQLQSLLMKQAVPNEPLVFKSNGNQLADAFKQLFEANLIVGCNKIELINWIQEHFEYVDRGSVKSFSEKYLLDIISSNTKICQSPILNVRKKDGQFVILLEQRNNRNSKN
ncbi:hypothetical protein EXU57_15915 [Segetibacter sp. 3557_3]|uniref:hypothetical protein n=1 Tax=Segetibacter sp. 3557_3 TaxID=2547429 RepID=UPI0010591378|nr:hypothetical protein [Segetibacter sp. 3557_3]TDH23977.1 hypothetical protein EXU57_15915 [Segetibacter sp. 3557_3]